MTYKHFKDEPNPLRCANKPHCKRYARQQPWKTELEKKYCFTCYQEISVVSSISKALSGAYKR